MTDFVVSDADSLKVVALPKRVDVSNSEKLLAVVRSHTGSGGTRFALDLSSTEAVDSTALGAMVALYKSLRVGEGDLVLVGVSEAVMRVLNITRLDNVFRIFKSVNEAVETYSSS